MKSRVVVVALALLCLAASIATMRTVSAPATGMTVAQPLPALPAAVAALAGLWEGIWPDALPARLVVEDLHENWAIVLYTWGDQPEGKFQKGWLRVRAKVLPDGTLFWRYPGDFTFRLSEDWTALVGTREQAGRKATSLMRRVPSQVPLNALTSGESK